MSIMKGERVVIFELHGHTVIALRQVKINRSRSVLNAGHSSTANFF